MLERRDETQPASAEAIVASKSNAKKAHKLFGGNTHGTRPKDAGASRRHVTCDILAKLT